MYDRELISKRTRVEFREYLVGYTLREIEKEFSAEDLHPDSGFEPNLGGQRREFVEQFYHNIDFSDSKDVWKLLRVYESILTDARLSLDSAGFTGDRDNLNQSVKRLVTCLKRDGFEFVDGRICSSAHHSSFSNLQSVAGTVGSRHLASQIQRISESVEKDTDLAIGQAKELLETCCKIILDDRKVEYDDRLEVQPLVRKTMAELSLMPSDIQEGAKGEKTIKAILGNLSVIAQGMAELRNLYGTGHGKQATHRSVPVRHARLAVGAATTLAQFLFDTHAERKDQ